MRVVRFYVSCLLLSSSPLLLLLLNRDPRRTVFSVGPQPHHPRPVFPAGPQPRPSPPSVPCRTSTTTIHAQCSLPDLNREYPRQVLPAGPHVGRYGTKNVQKKVRKNVRQVCYILLANSRVCGRVTGAMPLLTLQVAKFEAISLNRWQSHWGGQRHFHFCTFGAVCKDAWDRQHLTASYYKLLEVISCWIDAWDSQHHTGFLLCITAMVAWWICDIGTFVGASEPCWELWSLLHMAHWHVYILFDRLTCTMTCQVKQMIGIVSWAKVPWQKLQTKVVSTSCFEMSWWGSLEAK